ncbi:2-amino-4-hydroxy-6-hydroxymethyldihydropteridine diphosphokinase [Streptococcus sp. DD12]|uniref:2-amino-4-hydroxy-6- hydroxymethyldihydropteridine diphosphokinase n=1 Tax=Streptococcus sp. DD12 TaxID=1777880 RepID=UPI0007986F5A|nr:2-amino-4-hydroxy-6-hydroxymethyldihydropteridine diphosphokinase [Streptococcus sp. DD12]KXT76556.1 2-amino-4-hydroxy-6- hydroxymethyldihydropteridine pyrophosphokinase [Streptococcus sp. DD12]
MARVYLGLGSNMGNRLATLEGAYEKLANLPQTQLLGQSSYYETKAWGMTDQADFINAVCLLETQLTPEQLLEACQTIEADFGRKRLVHWGPRTLDIDILLYDDLILDKERLRLPHPYIKVRPFVLVPLLELAPELIDPQTRLAYAEALKSLGNDDIKRL